MRAYKKSDDYDPRILKKLKRDYTFCLFAGSVALMIGLFSLKAAVPGGAVGSKGSWLIGGAMGACVGFSAAFVFFNRAVGLNEEVKTFEGVEAKLDNFGKICR